MGNRWATWKFLEYRIRGLWNYSDCKTYPEFLDQGWWYLRGGEKVLRSVVSGVDVQVVARGIIVVVVVREKNMAGNLS